MSDPPRAAGLADVGAAERGEQGPLLLGVFWHDDVAGPGGRERGAGGLDRYFSELFAAVRRGGLRPRAVVLGPARTAPVGVTTGAHFERSLPVRILGFTRAAARAATDTTVVDAHFAMYAFWPVVFGRLRHLPLVVHFQGPWADESSAAGETSRWRTGARRMVERAVYRRAREVVVLSAPFKRILLERYGVSPWRVNVVSPGVDLVRFSLGNRNASRVAIGLPTGAPVVVCVRRLVPRMGIDVLVEAWRAVADQHPEALLVLVGDGAERSALEALAARSGIADSVRFLGRVDDETLARCYQAADVSVVPSTALEGFGLVVLESLACGTPVVTTDAGGLPEAIAGLDPGLIVPAADAEALARRICGALDGDVPGHERCRSHAASFDWTAIANRHHDIYRRAVAPAPARPARLQRIESGRRMRVVYLGHCAQLSGAELALLRLLPAMTQVDVHVILAEDGPLVAALTQAGVSVEVLPMAEAARGMGRHRVRPGGVPVTTLLSSGAHIARLAVRLRHLEPDIVHTNSLKAALYGGTAARLAGLPVIWHVRDRISADYLPPAACRLVRGAARVLPSGIIANSHATLETLGPAGIGGVVVPSPVSVGDLPVDRALDTNDGLRAGIVGRLAPWKGQDVFLDAFARAFPSGPQTAVVIGSALFGEDAYGQSLVDLATMLGLDGRVEFRGFRADVADELSQLDILVHASTIPEPFGQVVVEGMAAGLAVVAADAGGPREIVEDGVDGVLYPPGDADALARVLQDLAADPQRRRRLGDAGQRRAADFSPERVAAEVMTLYRDVVGRQRATGRRR